MNRSPYPSTAIAEGATRRLPSTTIVAPAKIVDRMDGLPILMTFALSSSATYRSPAPSAAMLRWLPRPERSTLLSAAFNAPD